MRRRRRRLLAPPDGAADALGPLELLEVAVEVALRQAPPLPVEALLLELAALAALALAGAREAGREPVLARAVVLGGRRVRLHAAVHGVRERAAHEGRAEGAVAGAVREGCFVCKFSAVSLVTHKF